MKCSICEKDLGISNDRIVGKSPNLVCSNKECPMCLYCLKWDKDGLLLRSFIPFDSSYLKFIDNESSAINSKVRMMILKSSKPKTIGSKIYDFFRLRKEK